MRASPFTLRGQTRSRATGISRSDSRVSGRCLRNPSRGTRGTAVARLRFRQYQFQCATFLLLASGWTPERQKNGSVCKAIADASESAGCLAGVSLSLYNQPGDFVFPSERLKGANRSTWLRCEEEDPTGLQENRHHRCGLAHVPAHGWEPRWGPCWPRWANTNS